MKAFKILGIGLLLSVIFTAILYYNTDNGMGGSFFIGFITVLLSFVWPEITKYRKQQKAKQQ